MRTVPGTVAAAIESPERVIRHRVTADWDGDGYDGDGTLDDLTDKVGGVRSTQQLQTQIPEGVRLIAGNAAAQLDIDLARGNVIRRGVPAALRSTTSNRTTTGTGTAVSVAAPAGVQPGDVVLVFLAFANVQIGISDMPTGGNPNVAWALLSARGDMAADAVGFAGRVVVFALLRRAVAGEPATYTWTADEPCAWVATAAAVGGPYNGGIHAIATNGQGDGATAVRELQVGPLRTTLDGSTIVAFHAASVAAGKAATVTPGAGYTEAVEVTNTQTGAHNIIAELAYRDGAPAGVYTPSATIDPPAVLNSNPDVETDFSGWLASGAPTLGSAARSNDVAHHGEWSVKLSPSGLSSLDQAVTAMFAVTAGTTYTVSGWLYADAYREQLGVVIYWYTSGGVVVSSVDNPTPATPGQWVFRTLTAVAPATTTQARAGFRVGGPSLDPSTTAVYGDQIMMRAGTVDADVDTPVGLGVAVAIAPAVAGDDAQHAAWTFSELNRASPYAGKPRADRRTRWSVEILADGGFYPIPIFTGLSVDAGGSSRSRSAKLVAIDNRTEWIEPQGQLPQILGEFPDIGGDVLMPGLETTWFVSWLFWRGRTVPTQSAAYRPEIGGPAAGYGNFASPNIRRTSTVFYAPLHGSMMQFVPTPGVGGLDDIKESWTLQNDGRIRRVRFGSGPYVAAPEDPAPLGRVYTRWWYTDFLDASVENLATGQYIGRFELAARRYLDGGAASFRMHMAIDQNYKYVELRFLASGTLQLELKSPTGVVRTVNGPAYPTDGGWHWYGARFDSTTPNVVFSIDGVDTTVAFAAWSSAADATGLQWEAVYDCGPGWQLAELQINGSVGTGGLTPTAPWAWTGFVPSAFIDKSENELDITPPVDAGDDAYTIVQKIAAAEFAAHYRDADGYPHFRTVRSDITTAGQTVARTVTAVTPLKDVDYASGVTQVRNSITVPYTPVELHIDEALQLSGTYRIPAYGDLVIPVTLGGPALGTWYGPGAPSALVTEANRLPDGSGAVVPPYLYGFGISTTPGSTAAQIRVSSSAPYEIFLVDTAGAITLSAEASWYTFGSEVDVVVEHDESIRQHRRRPYQVDSSPWRQREEAAHQLASRVCDDLAFARPTLRSVRIVGDPRLEIGDLVRVVDSDGLGIDGMFRISGLSPAGSPDGGFEQTVTARSAPIAGSWDASYWDDGSVWSA